MGILVAAISEASPAGEDPGYDDDFQRMREEVNKLSAADVDHVMELAEKLLTHRCKDLRVATYYLWARLRKDGEAGLADGLSLLAALVERFSGPLPSSKSAATRPPATAANPAQQPVTGKPSA